METKVKQQRKIPTDPKKQAAFLKEMSEELKDRDFFPESNARAKKFFEGLENSQKKALSR